MYGLDRRPPWEPASYLALVVAASRARADRKPLRWNGVQRDAGSQRGPLPQRSEEATPGIAAQHGRAIQPQRSPIMAGQGGQTSGP